MIPILFEAGTTSFTSNGIGRLADAVSCVVTEERNGIYECELVYPITGPLYKQIRDGCIIYATHDDTGVAQPFDIYAASKPINGLVTFYASHVSSRLNKITDEPFTATSVSDVFSKLAGKAVNPCPFTFWTDKSTVGPYEVSEPRTIRSILGGEEGSVLDVYGKGDYEWDGFTVKLHLNRGSDSGVEIRYGKNLADINVEQDSGGTYDAIVPYWKSEDDEGATVIVMLPEKVVGYGADSGYDLLATENDEIIQNENDVDLEVESIGGIRAIPVDFTDKFEDQPTEAQLRAAAQSYLANADGWIPTENISIDFVQLWQTEEYAEFAPLQRLKLCDTVSIYYPELGVIREKQKVIRTEFNTLLDRYDRIEVGEPQTTLGDEILGVVSEDLDAIRSAVQTSLNALEASLQADIEAATEAITGNDGGYVQIHYNANGKPYEITIADNEDISQAVKVWRWNQGGFGYSSTGYDGPYTTAITMNGAIVADFITTGTLTANLIKAGILSDVNGVTTFNLSTGALSCSNISITGGSLTIGNDFAVSSGGSLTAKAGEIGGFEIGNLSLRYVGGISDAYETKMSATGFYHTMDGGTKYTEIQGGSLTNTGYFSSTNSSELSNGDYEISVDSLGIQIRNDMNNDGPGIEVKGNEVYLYPGQHTSSAAPNLRLVTGNPTDAVRRTTWTPSSSRQLKKNITPKIGDKLDPHRLYDLDVVQFEYTDEYYERTRLDPEDPRYKVPLLGIVIEEMDEIYPIAIDKDDPEDPKTWTRNDSHLIMPMLRLIQEQKKQIEDLTARLEAVERRLNDGN